jgi:uncharacterized membrane protein YbaN (DUF454 family)
VKKRFSHPHPILRFARLIVGILLVIVGVIGILIPVMPQWPFLIPGLMLLAPESRQIRRLVLWLRKRLRLRRWRKMRSRAVTGQDAAASTPQVAVQVPAADGESLRKKASEGKKP